MLSRWYKFGVEGHSPTLSLITVSSCYINYPDNFAVND